jgi:hypothetical protein
MGLQGGLIIFGTHDKILLGDPDIVEIDLPLA